MIRYLFATCFLAVNFCYSLNAQQNDVHSNNGTINQNPVNVIGAMKNVMWKGELFGKINLDTIPNKSHLYGLGPTENLTGEILILDGKSFKSIAVGDSAMSVEETYNIKAPFFSYTNITEWSEMSVPDSVVNLQQLETYIMKITENREQPFFFKVTTSVDDAHIHIVDLPTGTIVKSPTDAHQNQKTYPLRNQEVIMIGFFSTRHQAIFTHHDTFMHIHLITADYKKMGHLDFLAISKGTARLFLPK